MSQHPRPVLTRLATPSALLLALLAACATPHGARSAFNSDVDLLIAQGRYDGAVRLAARGAAANPDNSAAEATHLRASVAWHLEKGRRATFDDRDREALDWFALALALDPESALVTSWIKKTQQKISRAEMTSAQEALAGDALWAAVRSYRTILEDEPHHAAAQAGLDQTLSRLEFRDGIADSYYRDGVDALAALWLEQARSRFAYSNKYREGDEHTAQRRGDVDWLLAGQRLALGTGLEANGHYHAARVEYRMALKLDPDNPQAEVGAARMELEVVTAREIERARMDIMRGNLDRALAALHRAAATTEIQSDTVTGLMDEIDATRTENRYQDARSLERDHRFEAARDVYAALLDDVSFYNDARARHATLEDYIEEARELYGKAAEASDPTERRNLLRQIEFFWPEYRDVAEQLAK
jgi:hypothetical protein